MSMLDVQNVDVWFTLPNKKECRGLELWGTRRVTQQSYENQLVDCRNFDEEIEADRCVPFGIKGMRRDYAQQKSCPPSPS